MILALCLSIIACTLAVPMVLLSEVYSIAGNMQASISTTKRSTNFPATSRTPIPLISHFSPA